MIEEMCVVSGLTPHRRTDESHPTSATADQDWADLEAVSWSLLTDEQQAVIDIDLESLATLRDEAAAQDPVLARELSQLIATYQFDRIQALCEDL